MGTCHTPGLPIPSASLWGHPKMRGETSWPSGMGGASAQGTGCGFVSVPVQFNTRLGTGIEVKPRSYPPPATPLPGEERPRRDLPRLLAGASRLPQGYLHAGVVGSIDFVSADGGHWHIAPERGAGGREEGQRVHATQRRADHNRGAQVQGLHHSCQEAAGDQLPHRGRGCCVLGTPQACRDFRVEETRQAGEWEGPFPQKALLGPSLRAARPALFLPQPERSCPWPP